MYQFRRYIAYMSTSMLISQKIERNHSFQTSTASVFKNPSSQLRRQINILDTSRSFSKIFSHFWDQTTQSNSVIPTSYYEYSRREKNFRTSLSSHLCNHSLGGVPRISIISTWRRSMTGNARFVYYTIHIRVRAHYTKQVSTYLHSYIGVCLCMYLGIVSTQVLA